MKTRADSNNAFLKSGNVRMRQSLQFLTMSESSVSRLIKDTYFPAHLSSRLVVFDATDIR
ncbi:AlpA family phage regulatory protein [Franconibacter pulveris 601]|uniref:AlpA family phage regulatory protein n=1 Tax=Franconibacter pulveris TaxID=435910 RepID=UPI000489F10F|nr:AlpA family phage regulatory protein [Franconibacter pulveris]